MSFLRDVFLSNLGLKALSLVLAFLFWMQIAGRERVQRIISAPIVFENVPENLEITGDFPTQVEVVIRSERPGGQVAANDLLVIVDLGASKPGVQTIPLSGKNVKNKPLGVDIVNLLTSRIRIVLEQVEQRSVDVEAQVIGRPAPGYRMAAVTIDPGSMTVIGPQTRIRRISRVLTEPVSIEGTSTTVRRDVYLHLPDPPVRLAGSQVVMVTVTIVADKPQPAPRRR
ncbi:MAG: hypothetical protein EHM61_07245 [Acidobacteria bacterium]|nr:MAG: hypothetical protein EHM61_07245 [Acidobacteriota bacterium]